MAFKINALKKLDYLVSNPDENPLETLTESFDTKEEALAFIKNNLEVIILGGEFDVIGINYGGFVYHYFQLEETLS
jgi:arginine utilization protein RocB